MQGSKTRPRVRLPQASKTLECFSQLGVQCREEPRRYPETAKRASHGAAGFSDLGLQLRQGAVGRSRPPAVCLGIDLGGPRAGVWRTARPPAAREGRADPPASARLVAGGFRGGRGATSSSSFVRCLSLTGRRVSLVDFIFKAKGKRRKRGQLRTVGRRGAEPAGTSP